MAVLRVVTISCIVFVHCWMQIIHARPLRTLLTKESADPAISTETTEASPLPFPKSQSYSIIIADGAKKDEIETQDTPDGANFKIDSSAVKFTLEKKWWFPIANDNIKINGETMKDKKMTFDKLHRGDKFDIIVTGDDAKMNELLPPCYAGTDGKLEYVDSEKPAWFLPQVLQKSDGTMCLSILEQQEALEIKAIYIGNDGKEQKASKSIRVIGQPARISWKSKELQTSIDYCKKKKDKKICDNDQDPNVFYDDNHFAFYRGWPNNWFQGYAITPNTKPYRASNPCGTSQDPNQQCDSIKNQFSFLTFNGWKWASSEHFLFWARDELFFGSTDKSHAHDIVMASGDKQVQTKINKLHQHLALTQTSPKAIFKQARKWNNEADGAGKGRWFACNFWIQIKGLWLKFTQNKDLKLKLLATGNRNIFESSPIDDTYGIANFDSELNGKRGQYGWGLDDDNLMQAISQYAEGYFMDGFINSKNKPATNILGRALMVTRELIKLSDKLGKNEITFDDLKQAAIDAAQIKSMKQLTGIKAENGHILDNQDAILRAYITVTQSDYGKCIPALKSKNMDWLELNKFSLPQAHSDPMAN